MSKQSIADFINNILNNKDFLTNVTAHFHLDAQPAKTIEFPDALNPMLTNALHEIGIHQLYSHQAEAIEHILKGENVSIVTPTASGKTLCYNIPVINSVLNDHDTKALYIFPTKALSQDQMVELQHLLNGVPHPIATYTFDGDTPADARKAIRTKGNIVITNPDMLHQGILPHHTKWIRLFENLKYIVIDEMHIYRGVFGSNVANLLRRLQRITEFYNAKPQFIFCSATIANPKELAEQLINQPVTLIDNNGAPKAKKHFIIYNPPVVNPILGIRASAPKEANKLAMQFIRHGIQTLIFTTTRLKVEIITRYLKDAFDKKAAYDTGTIRGYRGGFLPKTRREIEKGLKSGEVRGVVSTNALELGIDIGQLDACIICEYPGSIASTWQQAGRAGRRSGESLAILVAGSSPIDQFLANNPEYFIGRSPENARINPANLAILVNHIKCAAFELPFLDKEQFGAKDIEPILSYLQEHGVINHSGDKWHWMHDSYPADQISLRRGTEENFIVIDMTNSNVVIAEVDFFDAMTTIFEGAIYLLESEPYQVEKLDFENRKAFVKLVDVDYYTQAITYSKVKILDVFNTNSTEYTIIEHGEVHVVRHASGYKKIKFYTHENIGFGDIKLPDQEMHTTAYWFTINESIRDILQLSRQEMLDGIAGITRALNYVASLHLMCEPHDIGYTIGDKSSQWFLQNTKRIDLAGETNLVIENPNEETFFNLESFEPTIFLYDNFPGGISLAESLYEAHDILLQRTYDLIVKCFCRDGCPSCVGPANETGPEAKENALRILAFLIPSK